MPEYMQLVTDRQVCFACHKTERGKKKFPKCAKCHAITYCGKECQKADWLRHKLNCVPVMVTDIPGKGRGLVAARDIKMGEEIFKDKPSIRLPSLENTGPDTSESLMKQIENLPSEAKSLFYKLDYRKSKSFLLDAPLEMDMFYNNCTILGNETLLYLNRSLINHSCAPNSAVGSADVPKEGEDNIVIARAIKNISKGEEISIFYQFDLSPMIPSYKIFGCNAQDRMRIIKDEFDFDCKCSVCSGNVRDQEDIIRKLLQLHGTLDDLNSDQTKDWARELQIRRKILDLNLKLYIGSVYDKANAIYMMYTTARMARDVFQQRRAINEFKKLAEDTKLAPFKLQYDALEAKFSSGN